MSSKKSVFVDAIIWEALDLARRVGEEDISLVRRVLLRGLGRISTDRRWSAERARKRVAGRRAEGKNNVVDQ